MKFRLHICFSALLETCSFCKKEREWNRSVMSDSCDPMDCSLPGFSVHGIFQARVLEWVAISFSRRSSLPRDWTRVSYIVGRCFTVWATREFIPISFFLCWLFINLLSKSQLSLKLRLLRKHRTEFIFLRNLRSVYFFKTIWEGGERKMDWELGVGRCY